MIPRLLLASSPMILLAFGVAVPYLHTRLARLETDASLLAALGTDEGIIAMIHFKIPTERRF